MTHPYLFPAPRRQRTVCWGLELIRGLSKRPGGGNVNGDGTGRKVEGTKKQGVTVGGMNNARRTDNDK